MLGTYLMKNVMPNTIGGKAPPMNENNAEDDDN
jgi:hypothetical protein